MTDSSGDDLDTSNEWVFYKDRPEWADVVPIQQEEGPSPVVSIRYSDKFKDIYDYVRAIMKKNEYSERAFNLTTDALKMNPANYSVWQYRRILLKELEKDLYKELEYLEDVIMRNPKNYQVWHHRMIIVEWLSDPSQEFEFLKRAMSQDAKNYHAWKHRQWLLKTFNLFDNELEYTEQLIEKDIRNNSAWNQRYFVLNYTSKLNDRDALLKEIKFTMDAILQATLNESSWNFLRGVLIHMEKGLLEPEVLKFCWSLYDRGNRSPHLLGYLVDACAEAVDVKFSSDPRCSIEKGVELCKELGEKQDTIRVKYWNYMIDVLDAKRKNKLISDDIDTEKQEEMQETSV
ncbi:protein farnesyltransferase/geranylgeranyltransferase type-1 subunit alpha [Cimex lectularius]|uniref:Protein farnesyltransferase/geranylgeranyltransferase type-1 subunit alpha n=1 Tax=Cimex lectularius TaxID=79782 RepID=A0A8I6SJM5_CIMLE|nr:protein farnesyltransferase/geranylgeranyltransferase type-1 subunit alpha [Cimex lectularius]